MEEAVTTAEPSAKLLSKGGEKLYWTATFKAPARVWSPSRRRRTRASPGRLGLPAAGEKLKEEEVFEANEEALEVAAQGLQVGPAAEGLQGQQHGA